MMSFIYDCVSRMKPWWCGMEAYYSKCLYLSANAKDINGVMDEFVTYLSLLNIQNAT